MNQCFKEWHNYCTDYDHPFWTWEYERFIDTMTNESSPLFSEEDDEEDNPAGLFMMDTRRLYSHHEIIKIMHSIINMPGGDFFHYRGLKLLEEMENNYKDVYLFFEMLRNIYHSLLKLDLIGLDISNLYFDATHRGLCEDM